MTQISRRRCMASRSGVEHGIEDRTKVCVMPVEESEAEGPMSEDEGDGEKVKEEQEEEDAKAKTEASDGAPEEELSLEAILLEEEEAKAKAEAAAAAAAGAPAAEAEAEEEEAEEDGPDRELAGLPVQELKRRLRAKGVAVPADLNDKDELIALLLRGEEPAAPDDPFASFMDEIEGLGTEAPGDEPQASGAASGGAPTGDPAEVEEAGAGAPGAEAGAAVAQGAEPGAEAAEEEAAEKEPAAPAAPAKPFTVRYDARRRAWVVALGHGLGERAFAAERDAIRARHAALRYCAAKFRALEAGELRSAAADEAAEEEEEEEERLRARCAGAARTGVGALDRLPRICRGLRFNTFHLLVQFGCGKARGKRLHTGNLLDNATENPLEHPSENPLGK